jgi:hypothetical protein
MDDGMPVRYFVGLYGAGTHRLLGGHVAHFATRSSFHLYVQRSSSGSDAGAGDWTAGDLAAYAEKKGWQIVYAVDRSQHSSTIGAGIVPHDSSGAVAAGAQVSRWRRSGVMQFINVKVPGYAARQQAGAKSIILTSLGAFPHLLARDMQYGEMDDMEDASMTGITKKGKGTSKGLGAEAERAQMGRLAGGAVVTLTVDGCQLHMGAVPPSVYQPRRRHKGQAGHVSLNWLNYMPQLDCAVSVFSSWEEGCECMSNANYIDPSYEVTSEAGYRPKIGTESKHFHFKMGYQMRSRTVAHKPDQVGKGCPHLREYRECTASGIVNAGCKTADTVDVPKEADDLQFKEQQLALQKKKASLALKKKEEIARLDLRPKCADMPTGCNGQLFFEVGIEQRTAGQFSTAMKTRILSGAQQLCNVNAVDATLSLAHGTRGSYLNLRVTCNVASMMLAQNLLTAVRTTIFVDQFSAQIST